jgi:hypothetical protein
LARSVLYDATIAKYDVVVSAIPGPPTQEAIGVTKRFVFPVSLKPVGIPEGGDDLVFRHPLTNALYSLARGTGRHSSHKRYSEHESPHGTSIMRPNYLVMKTEAKNDAVE